MRIGSMNPVDTGKVLINFSLKDLFLKGIKANINPNPAPSNKIMTRLVSTSTKKNNEPDFSDRLNFPK